MTSSSAFIEAIKKTDELYAKYGYRPESYYHFSFDNLHLILTKESDFGLYGLWCVDTHEAWDISYDKNNNNITYRTNDYAIRHPEIWEQLNLR